MTSPASATTVAAQVMTSLAVMLAATACVGLAAGGGYRGSLQVVNQLAPEHRRAAVVSSYFVCCFIGNALPVIGVAVLSNLTNATIADVAFAGVISAFSLIALVFATVYRRQDTDNQYALFVKFGAGNSAGLYLLF